MPRPLIMEAQAMLAGLRRDAEGEGIYLSFEVLENLDILRDPLPHLSVRSGYTRWNAVALATPPRQLLRFGWQNQSILINGQSEIVFVLLENGDIYQVGATGTPIRIYDGTSGMPTRIPGLSIGDRFFFGTETAGGAKGFYWTDPAGVIAGTSYPVGMDAPNSDTIIISHTSGGYSSGSVLFVELARDEQLAESVAITVDTIIDGFSLSLDRDGLTSSGGNIRVLLQRIVGGIPDDTPLVLTEWVSVQDVGLGGFASFFLGLEVPFTLKAGVTYAIVLDGDESYDDTFISGSNRIKWQYDALDVYLNGQAYQKAASWSGLAGDFAFTLGGLGLANTQKYRYAIAAYNRNYRIESPPTAPLHIVGTSTDTGVLITGLPAISGQVTDYTLYRTRGNIPDIYYRVGQVSGTTVRDLVGDAYLTLRAPTFRIQPLQDSDGNRLAPTYLVHWNGRIWASVANRGTLYYSAQLEEEGALGQAGNSLYDVFPANNTWVFGLGEPITGLYNFYDRLVVTFQSHIRVLRGGDSPLNPPDDLYLEEAINLEGCPDGGSIVEVLGKLVFVNQHHEVKAYQGGPATLDVNDFNFSLWQGLDGPFRAANIQNQYWCLSRRSGSSEVWIYNASTESPRWTLYRYNTNLNDIGIRNDGTILACDANSNYLLELNQGVSDHGALITAVAKTHPVPSENPRGRSRWNRVLLSAYYPETVPVVTIEGINRLNQAQGKTIVPAGSDGSREHWTGLRILSEQCAARITLQGQSNNQIRRIWLGSTRQSL